MADTSRERIELALADLWDPPLAALRQQLAERFAAEMETVRRETAEQTAADTAPKVRWSASEGLHLGVRRILHAATVTDIGAALLESAAPYCGRVALLVHKDGHLSGWRTCGTGDGNADAAAAEALAQAWSALRIPVAGAPAFAQAIETREAVVTLSMPDHLSSEVVGLFGLAPDEKVCLFPLSLRQTVVGVVYADSRGAAGGVLTPAIELLTAVAEAALEAVSSRAPAARTPTPEAAGRLELPVARPAPPPPVEWDQLTPEEREQHLRAQRFARVLVADLQLYRASQIREGKRARDLYGCLRDEIDKSREAYQRKFGHAATAGIDYFHVELVRTLADNQEELLGPDYPGPLPATFAVS